MQNIFQKLNTVLDKQLKAEERKATVITRAENIREIRKEREQQERIEAKQKAKNESTTRRVVDVAQSKFMNSAVGRLAGRAGQKATELNEKLNATSEKIWRGITNMGATLKSIAMPVVMFAIKGLVIFGAIAAGITMIVYAISSLKRVIMNAFGQKTAGQEYEEKLRAKYGLKNEATSSKGGGLLEKAIQGVGGLFGKGVTAAAGGVKEAAVSTVAAINKPIDTAVKTVTGGKYASLGAAVEGGAQKVGDTYRSAKAGAFKVAGDVVAALTGSAKATGVSQSRLTKFAAIESGFKANAKAGTSSAGGLFQFTDATWKEMLKKYGGKYGLGGGADKFDPKANALMGAEFLKQNEAYLKKKLGREVSDADLYSAHFLGAGGAVKLAKADANASAASVMGDSVAKANKDIFYDKSSGKARSVGEVQAILAKKVDSAPGSISGMAAETAVASNAASQQNPAAAKQAADTTAAAIEKGMTAALAKVAGNTDPRVSNVFTDMATRSPV